MKLFDSVASESVSFFPFNVNATADNNHLELGMFPDSQTADEIVRFCSCLGDFSAVAARV